VCESVHITVEGIEFACVEYEALGEGLGEEDVCQVDIGAIEDRKIPGEGWW
jgi:hypothetical protein